MSGKYRGGCSPGMRMCRRDCLHRQMIEEYRDAVLAREALRESGEYMQHEYEDFQREVPPVLFRDWLKEWAAGRRDPGYDEGTTDDGQEA